MPMGSVWMRLLAAVALAPAATVAHAATLMKIYTLTGSNQPVIDDLVEKGGVLYGTARNYSTAECYPCTTVFSVTPKGVGTTLYTSPMSFKDEPYGLLATASSFYVSDSHYILTLTSAGAQSRLLHFTPTVAAFLSPLVPYGSVLAGTANEGGLITSTYPRGAGAVFTLSKSSPKGSYKALYTFLGGADGAYPTGAPVDVGGTLYGVTYSGGANNSGVFYSVSPAGTENVLFSFGATNNLNDASSPIYTGGKFYGTANIETTGVRGILYSVDTSGHMVVLHSFSEAEGFPGGASLTALNGKVYGYTDSASGGGIAGEFYSVDADGTFTVVSTYSDTTFVPETPMVAIGSSLYLGAFTADIYKFTP